MKFQKVIIINKEDALRSFSETDLQNAIKNIENGKYDGGGPGEFISADIDRGDWCLQFTVISWGKILKLKYETCAG